MRWRLLVVVAAGIAAIVPTPPVVVERYYSTLFYPPMQRRLTGLSNLADFALFDALIAGTLLIWTTLLLRDVLLHRGTTRWLFVRFSLRTATAIACFYLLFLFTWGLNYRRVPLAQKLAFDAASVSPAAAVDLAATAVAEMNRLYPSTIEARQLAVSERVDPSMEQAFAEAQQLLGTSTLARPGRPKHTLLNWYFRRAAVDGMTDPYFLETLVLADLLPVERPIVIAHEWAHLAGYADEGDANFVGWLACLRSSPQARYSAWLFLYSEAARGLPSPERVRVAGAIAAGPRSDLQAIARRFQTDVNPALSAAGWRVYDRYLKANRIERGTESYSDVVRLVLGTPLGSRVTPALGSTRNRTRSTGGSPRRG